MKRTSNPLELVRLLINGANEYEKETGNKNPTVYLSRNNLLVIERALERLEAIDNSNPSEALECLEWISRELKIYYEHLYIVLRDSKEELISNMKKANEYLDTIKQALLNAQEPKQYLKWEDLEFDHKPKYIDVKMGDNKYLLIVGFSDGGNEMAILQTKLRRHYFVESEDNKQFFNDLHLEVLE